MKYLYTATKSEIMSEIKRVELAINESKSKNLQNDYKKYLARLCLELRRRTRQQRLT